MTRSQRTGTGSPPSPAASLVGLLSEKDWQSRVTDLARLRGWRCFHPLDSRGSSPGWPDLALARPGRLVLAELKSESGRVRLEQQEWLALLATVPGVEVHLWRPSAWPLVQEILR